MLQQTSLLAYYGLEQLPEKRRSVMEAIMILGEACNVDIADYLHLPINCITPRTNELVKIGFVEEAKRKVSWRTGRKVIYWRVK